MKYLKYCESYIGGADYTYDQRFVGKIEGQPKCAPTVICFKNPNTEVIRTVYTGKDIYKENESPIQYTWKYEYYNGHPAIIVNFSRIDSGYTNNIICLESNNMAKGSGNYNFTMPPNPYNLNGENNNRTLNVLKYEPNELNNETKNVTWYRLGDLNLNTDYPIYITVPNRYILGANCMTNGSIPNDWEVRINIRPTIRGSLSQRYGEITNSFTFRHTPHIPAKEYTLFKFLYRDIFQV